MQKLKLTYAKMDQVHCIIPGLFTSLKRGDRKKRKLDISHVYGGGNEARAIGFEPLGADDARLLYVLVALASSEGLALSAEPCSDMAKQLRVSLKLKSEASQQQAVVVQERVTKLLAEIGLTDSGNNIKGVRESLTRMSNVTFLITENSQLASFSLLSFGIDEIDGRIFVGLNPRIAEVALGFRASHVGVELAEVRQLKTDAAILMHLRLCALINKRSARPIGLDKLCEYVWIEKPNLEAMKKRRQTIRKALTELIDVGWAVDEYVYGKFKIARP